MLYLLILPSDRMWNTTVMYGMEPLITFGVCSLSCKNRYIILLVVLVLFFFNISLDFFCIIIKTCVHFMGIISVYLMSIF